MQTRVKNQKTIIPKEGLVRKQFSFVVATIAAIVMLAAVGASANPDVTLTYVNKYMVGAGSVVHNDPCLHVNVYMPIQSGWYADLWVSSGFDAKPNFGREVDYTAGYSASNWEVGGSFFDLNNVFELKTADIVDFFGEARYTVQIDSTRNFWLKPFARVEYMLVTRNTRDLSAGTYALGTKGNATLGIVGLSAEVKALYDDGVFGGDQGWVGRLSASISVNPKNGVLTSISVGVKQTLLVGIHDARRPETVFTAGASFGF